MLYHGSAPDYPGGNHLGKGGPDEDVVYDVERPWKEMREEVLRELDLELQPPFDQQQAILADDGGIQRPPDARELRQRMRRIITLVKNRR